MSAKFNLSTRANNVSKMKTAQTFKEVDAPSSSHDFWSTFKKSSAVKSGLTNDFYVYTMPDFTCILMFIIYHCLQASATIDARNHPKVSVPILVAYCLTIVYGHFLISDAYINPGQAHYALEIRNDSAYQEYLEYILTLPVPAFLVPILRQFTSCATETRSNLWFLASFQGFTHFTHFGRFFPINLFTSMHDIAASSSARTNVNEIFTDLVSTIIFTLKEYRDPAHSAITVTNRHFHYANFFAAAYPTTANSARSQNMFIESKLNQCLQGLFNPVMMRSMQQKQAFSEVYINAPVFDNANYNPFIATLCMTKVNIPELIVIFDSVAETINGSIPLSGQLSSIYDQYQGQDILRHGYSLFPTPTWDHETSITDYDDLLTGANGNTVLLKSYTSQPLANYAAAIAFKQAKQSITWTVEDRPLATITRDIPAPAITAPTPDNVIVTVHFTPNTPGHAQNLLRLLTDRLSADQQASFQVPEPSGPANANDAANLNHLYTIRQYSSEIDDYPVVKILDPIQADIVTAHMATICGLVIQSDELYASIVTHPHRATRCEEDTAQFLGSAIPFRSVVLGSLFKTNNPYPTLVTDTTPATSLRQPAFTLFRAPHVVIPSLTRSIAFWRNDTPHPGIRSSTGLVSIPELSQTVLSYTVRDRAQRNFNATENAPANSANHNLLVWSPYVFVSPLADYEWETNDWSDALRDRHFLTNLRTIFGTNAPLMEVNSGSRAMPTA